MARFLNYTDSVNIYCYSDKREVAKLSQRMYYWIVAHDTDNKPYLIFGSDKSEEDARQQGLEMLGGVDFEIKKFPTRDLASASSMLKGKKLKETHSLKKATERLGHEKSVNRLKNKRKKSNYPFF